MTTAPPLACMLLTHQIMDTAMGRRKTPGRSKRSRDPEPRQRRAAPKPPLMTYDPYLVKLTRSLEAAKDRPKARGGH